MADRNLEQGLTYVTNLSRFAIEAFTKLGIPAGVATMARHAGVDVFSSAALATGLGMTVSALYNRFIEGIERPEAYADRAPIAFKQMLEGALWGAGAAGAAVTATDPGVMHAVASVKDGIMSIAQYVQQLIPDKSPTDPQQYVPWPESPPLPAVELPIATPLPPEPFIDPEIIEIWPWCAAGAGAVVLALLPGLGKRKSGRK